MLRAFSFLLFFLSCLTPLSGLETVRLAEHIQKNEKPALLVFLSLNSCPWCDKLIKEVLDQEQFRQSIGESFNLLKVYMSDGSQEEICKKYHIDQVPMFVLIDKEGMEITRVGYLPKTPQEMAEHLKGLLTKVELLQDKMAQIDLKAVPIEILRHYYTEAKTIGFKKLQMELLSTGLQVDSGTFFLLEQYKNYLGLDRKKAKNIKEEIKSRDPNNEEGSQLQLALLEFQERQELSLTLEEVIKPLKKYLKHFGQEDKEHRWQVEMTLAQYCLSKGQEEKALDYARKALQDAPLEAQEDIKEAIQYIREIGKK